MPTTGFEPAHQMAPPPQDGMSTNFTTWALFGAKIMKTKRDTLVELYSLKKNQIQTEYLFTQTNP